MKESFWILLLVIGTGCGSVGLSNRTALAALIKPAEAYWKDAGFSEPQVASVSHLYIVKCARCHQVYNPTDYSGADWRSWMTRMSKKAHLTADQAQLLSQFTDTLRTAAELRGKNN